MPGAPGAMPGPTGAIPVPLPGGNPAASGAQPAIYPNANPNRRTPRSTMNNSSYVNPANGGFMTGGGPGQGLPAATINPGLPGAPGQQQLQQPEVDTAVQYIQMKADEELRRRQGVPSPPVPTL